MFAHFGLPSENRNWIKHFQGYYDLPEIYETIRSANKTFLRSMCHESNELMFKLTPSQDYQARAAIKKEKESAMASIKKTLGLKKQEVPQPVTEESYINEFESLPYEYSSTVSSYNPSQTNTSSPKKKRKYTMVGEDSISQRTSKSPKRKITTKSIFIWIIAAVLTIATCLLLFSILVSIISWLSILYALNGRKVAMWILFRYEKAKFNVFNFRLHRYYPKVYDVGRLVE